MVKPRSCNGLVLDDYLNTVASVRKSFRLPSPTLHFRKIESEPGARAAMAAIVDAIVNRCGSKIYTKVHPLLGAAANEIYAEPIKTEVYSGNKIREDRLGQTLRKTIELGLQTIVQLPSKERKQASVPKRLKSLALTLHRSAERFAALIHESDVRGRIDLWEDQAARTKLLGLPSEIRWSGEALNHIAKLKVRKIRVNSPNPQISFTMYLIGWIEAGTGKQHYEDVTELVQAAFCASRKPLPAWTERLAIEKHLHRKRRKQWVQTISS
jgi:hypothetical protein